MLLLVVAQAVYIQELVQELGVIVAAVQELAVWQILVVVLQEPLIKVNPGVVVVEDHHMQEAAVAVAPAADAAVVVLTRAVQAALARTVAKMRRERCFMFKRGVGRGRDCRASEESRNRLCRRPPPAVSPVSIRASFCFTRAT